MSITTFKGLNKNGKKIFELEVTQEDCDEMNELSKRLGLDKMPDYQELKPSKKEYLFG